MFEVELEFTTRMKYTVKAIGETEAEDEAIARWKDDFPGDNPDSVIVLAVQELDLEQSK